MAISRRQIISSGQQAQLVDETVASDEANDLALARHNQQVNKILMTNRRRDSNTKSKPARQTKLQRPSLTGNFLMTTPSNKQPLDTLTMNNNTESSDGYVVAGHSQSSSSNQTYEEYLDGEQDVQDYRHFDPYSIYSEEEDVWYSEERIFEDHLEEIHNKWSLLDDDIWCKLIIMERNRRIGKAYARVPLVTIDGSHELSYDGYKLALNGFDNPDRDDETEECRKRIGKGIRIKMDDFGNILIKRLSKSGVYIKEWLNPSTSSGSSNSTNGSSGAGVGRSMPSRRQLIKNSISGSSQQQNDPVANLMMSSSNLAPSSSSSSSNNDSAICDELLSVRGRLELDKIYVLFDMKKFQANVSQELCRAYPSRRKLEQQCFSIVGLSRDSEDVLNLPCWVMVINIVALEMLYGKFPMASEKDYASNKYARPSFTSIFEPQQSSRPSMTTTRRVDQQHSKEEDPYSLPANASSSDLKSSIHEYGPALNNNKHYYSRNNPPRSRASNNNNNNQQARHQSELSQQAKQRSKSNCNIYGQTRSSQLRAAERQFNSSIYSPGHMLVPTQQVPPKLPPRDFVAHKSRSSANLANKTDEFKAEEIYSAGKTMEQAPETKAPRKTKRNRFLESLRAPLELATRSNRCASVLGASESSPAEVEKSPVQVAGAAANASGKPKLSKARKLRSLLGGGGGGEKSSTSVSKTSDDYVRIDGLLGKDDSKLANGKKPTSSKDTSGEADSVVDSNEELEETSHKLASGANGSPANSSSYNDLDIPTPDYETDENIYALEQQQQQQPATLAPNNRRANRTRRFSTSYKDLQQQQPSITAKSKDDLYYSGFLAHVPSQQGREAAQQTQTGARLGGPRSSRLNGRSASTQLFQSAYAASSIGLPAGNNRLQINARRAIRAGDLIYGSSLGLQQQNNTNFLPRFRSASMQRHYPASSRLQSRLYQQQQDIYEPHLLDQYAMGAGEPNEQEYEFVQQQVQQQEQRLPRRSWLAKKSLQGQQQELATNNNNNISHGHYDLDRSSSGIYGNNSSSSSDYADWHPQVRKVNSSGYLNSIFKTGAAAMTSSGAHNNNNNKNQKQQDTVHNSQTTNPLNNNNNSNNNAAKTTANGSSSAYNNNNNHNKRIYSAKTSKPPTGVNAKTAASLMEAAKQTTSDNNNIRQPSNVCTTAPTTATYRSYDSPNDSDPSYTNSSDGLDIYDQIGTDRLLINGNSNNISEHHDHRRHNHKFLDRLAPEVHVGEWENMYDR